MRCASFPGLRPGARLRRGLRVRGALAAWPPRACLILTVTALALAPVGAASEPGPDDPTLGPLIAGTASHVDGTYVWTDYAYDDRGPDQDGRRGGDADYPAGMDPNNVADLIQLQLRQAGDAAMAITAVLQTLTPVTRPLIGVAFDSDSDGGTGSAALPGSWTPAAPLGMDRLFVLGVDGGVELVAASDGWAEVGTFAVAVDTERNTVAADVPFALPDHETLRAVGVVGYEHAGGSWLTGDHPVQDLAFVDDGWVSKPRLQAVTDAVMGFFSGQGAYWQDGVQASILAGDADPAPGVAEIDVAALREARTDLAEPEGQGFATFLYRSDLRLGEGVQGSGNDALYAGPYQPYLVWQPEDLRPELPLVMYLHGASQTHIDAVNTSPYDPDTGEPAHFSDFDAVVAWPLGRGPLQWYQGASEQDVLDVTDDVLDRLTLDRDRVMLAGLSMGGYGTFRLAQLYPDRWSLAYSDVGADQILGGAAGVNLLENLTNVPLRFQNGLVDPLVQVSQAHETRQLVDAAGTVDYRSWIRTRGTHQPVVELAKCVYLEAFERPRVTDPAQVRYTVNPSMFVDNPTTGLRLVYDGAYWVSGMTPAGNQRGSVDLETHALGWERVAGATTSELRQNIVTGRDFCGPNPEVRTFESWDEQARTVTREPRPAEPLLTGSLTGLSAVTIAADRAGLTGTGSATLELDTDEQLTLTLSGLAPGTAVTGAGTTVRAGGHGTASLDLPAGSTTVTLTRPGGGHG